MRSRILFLGQNLPFPPHGGATIRSYHTMRLLGQEFDVTAMCFDKTSMRSDSVTRVDAQERLRDFGKVEAFDIPQEGRAFRKVMDHLTSVCTRRAYTRWLYESTTFRARLRDMVREQDFDLVHLDSLDLIGYWNDLPSCPKVIVHHNIESQLLRRRSEVESGAVRAYMRHQASLLQKEEIRWAPKVDLNVVVSQEDADTLRQLAPSARCIVVPNGVDTQDFRPVECPQTDELVFVGGYGWFPNRDGMTHFVDEILPLIKKENPSIKVTWVGRAPEEVAAEMKRRGVMMTGYVDDIRPTVSRASCYIVPLRVGGGTRLKILDAWALGKAVVSTSRGCEGLAVHSRENLIVADRPEDFAEAVLEVLRDSQLREKLGQKGRETAVKTYDWAVVGRPLIDTYRKIMLPEMTSA